MYVFHVSYPGKNGEREEMECFGEGAKDAFVEHLIFTEGVDIDSIRCHADRESYEPGPFHVFYKSAVTGHKIRREFEDEYDMDCFVNGLVEGGISRTDIRVLTDGEWRDELEEWRPRAEASLLRFTKEAV